MAKGLVMAVMVAACVGAGCGNDGGGNGDVVERPAKGIHSVYCYPSGGTGVDCIGLLSVNGCSFEALFFNGQADEAEARVEMQRWIDEIDRSLTIGGCESEGFTTAQCECMYSYVEACGDAPANALAECFE